MFYAFVTTISSIWQCQHQLEEVILLCVDVDFVIIIVFIFINVNKNLNSTYYSKNIKGKNGKGKVH